MIPPAFLDQAEAFMLSQVQMHGMPSETLLNISLKKALALADAMGARKDVVHAGALLMDCQLGVANAESDITQHIPKAVHWAKQLFKKFPKIDHATQQAVLACIRDHHGAKKFYSLESEICCNADCYKFASVEGFFMATRFTRPMSVEQLTKTLAAKSEEKWNALSLDACKQELKPQYATIQQFLSYLS